MKIFRIGENDNVAVALKRINKGEIIMVSDNEITVTEDIEPGNKIAIAQINKDSDVIKYNNVIGRAVSDIKKGEFVHTHNLMTKLTDSNDYLYRKDIMEKSRKENAYFNAYENEMGYGIRNDIYIIPTVGCVNKVVNRIYNAASNLELGSVDNIIVFSHPYGCSQMGEDQENTRKILAAIADHPNASGVLLVGLGCENSNIEVLKDYIQRKDTIRYLNAQDHEDEVSVGLKLLKELIEESRNKKRTKTDISELVIGLKCGGSDGLSGITANPLVGKVSDEFIDFNASTIMCEVPEMFGGEHILMNRCKNKAVFNKLENMINSYKKFYTDLSLPVYENPSPGNKKGGISTLEEKSLGCIQKSGSREIVDVLDYGMSIREKGLNLLSSPGNDIVAITALAASRAQIILFTTGRGTPLASFVPTIKIATNSRISQHKADWIDFDAEPVISEDDFENQKNLLLELIIRTCNGEYLKSEKNGYQDIAILKTGATL